MVDLLAYLRSTFLNFAVLPGNVAQTACLSSCKHLAGSMRTLLLDDDVKQMNEHGLNWFNQDLRECEEFANSSPVEGISDGTLQMTFLELRQLVDLLLGCDWSTYLKDHGSTTSKYNRVNPQIAARLLEKLMESEKKRGFTIRKSEREKKKLMETIIKKLRALDGDVSGNSLLHARE
ncbi:predicted protein [Nematostella vectensis]|uniref:Exocyst complex subunit EXOC6/Sec15 C-terminal domain-containing protein n=1 Tax=Nematostella vectensis TaxID=45351 RepID=A7T027_NEMVE|nr:predicted protein [Nematostella vectensis]|eukprot:XP_001622799.1 hypothetical protein NEMVEDRAFT_v1g248297 [Nematostella vectensis]